MAPGFVWQTRPIKLATVTSQLSTARSIKNYLNIVDTLLTYMYYSVGARWGLMQIADSDLFNVYKCKKINQVGLITL